MFLFSIRWLTSTCSRQDTLNTHIDKAHGTRSKPVKRACQAKGGEDTEDEGEGATSEEDEDEYADK